MGATQIERSLEQWELGVKDAPPLWLLAQGWTRSAMTEMPERDPHTIGRWAAAFSEGGPRALIFEQTGGPPRALEPAQQEELKGAEWQ